MDPATALGVGVTTLDSLNKIGGAVAVLLGLLVLLAAVAIFLAVKAFRHLVGRLTATEDSRVSLLTGCIQDNARVLTRVEAATDRQTASIEKQTAIIDQQTAAMRSRPCLIESGVHQRTSLPR